MSKYSSSLLIPGLCIAGIVSGIGARQRWSSPPPSPGSEAAHNLRVRSTAAVKADSVRDLASFPARHSSETLETLAALPDERLYTPLALWLADASEPEIAAFWSTYSKKKKGSDDITNLILLNWTRLDPQAAIAGSADHPYAWWAWACHDPAAALAAANTDPENRLGAVTKGIGEFHPQWLRQHFQEIPESFRNNALEASNQWADRQNPLDALNFKRQMGVSSYADPDTLKALVRQDPWAAFDWVKQSPPPQFGVCHANQDKMQIVVDTMATEHPEELARLAAQTPSGALKLKMEAALFANLVKTDPEAAFEQAKSTAAPRIAAERYAALGLEIAKTDPIRAFEIAENLFEVFPDILQLAKGVEYPGGGYSLNVTDIFGGSTPKQGVDQFLKALVTQDPQRALEMILQLKSDLPENRAFSIASNQWAEQDLTAYSQWANRQSDTALRDQSVIIVIGKLQEQGNYAESADWILSLRGASNSQMVPYFLSRWKKADPQATTEWLQSADIPDARKTEIRTELDKVQ